LFEDPTSVEASVRAKEGAVLFDEVWFEVFRPADAPKGSVDLTSRMGSSTCAAKSRAASRWRAC